MQVAAAVFRTQFGAVARAASRYNGVWYSVVRYVALYWGTVHCTGVQCAVVRYGAL